MKILYVCLLIITLFTMTIQYNYQTYPSNYRRQLNNQYSPSNHYYYYNNYDNNNNNNNKGKRYDGNNNNNNNHYYYGHNRRKHGNYYPSKRYTNKKPKKMHLTRKYLMEGEAKHIHQKHGEKHIKSVGELFGFTDTYQGSDYSLTTTFHKGSLSTKYGKPKYFSTYDTEGQIKHYKNTHGRAKFNLNSKLHGHEKYKDLKEMKANITFENNDDTTDDESNYSPTNHPYGKLEEHSRKNSYDAINFPLKTIHGRKYDMEDGAGFVPDNYGNHDNHEDEDYDSYHSNNYDDGEEHNYGHVNLAEQSMNKLKELKRRKYNEYYKKDDEEEEGEYGKHDDDKPHEYPNEESPQRSTEAPRRTTTRPNSLAE
ncbi:unnamed protein product [Schistosoma guineensis]|nr:unnamed protein product [Schistosoma guineensis]